jgi:hypothetical protein
MQIKSKALMTFSKEIEFFCTQPHLIVLVPVFSDKEFIFIEHQPMKDKFISTA